MTYSYKYPHPAVATDCVVFGFDGRRLRILLIECGQDPYKGAWAFPGGFMRMDETAEACAVRELKEETSLNVHSLKQLGAFSAVHRDPRERVVSIAFYALVQPSDVMGGDDASQARWFPLDDVPQLAFDHDYILRKALQKLREDIYFEPVGFELLNQSFTMAELQRLYESILGVRFDRRNFERKMMQTGIIDLVDSDEEEKTFCISMHEKSCARPSRTNKLILGSEQAMKTMDISELFEPTERDLQSKGRPGRKGRRYSFNKDKYEDFRNHHNFRFEF